jgi:hypothetical protein
MPASITGRGTLDGSTCSQYSSDCAEKRLVLGTLTTLIRTPSPKMKRFVRRQKWAIELPPQVLALDMLAGLWVTYCYSVSSCNPTRWSIGYIWQRVGGWNPQAETP